MFFKLPNRTFIRQEEKEKPMKDRSTPLMCGNASGDFEVKQLLLYRSDNPGMLKRNNVMKSKLPVLLTANIKAWVILQFITEWTHEVFAPSVKYIFTKWNCH